MAIDWNERLFGSRSISSAVTLWPTSVLRVSTSGAASAVTWTVSGQLSDSHLRVDVERSSQQHADVGTFDLGETTQFKRDVVAPRTQVGRDVLAIGVGDIDPGLARDGIRDGDRDSGYRLTLLVCDGTLSVPKRSCAVTTPVAARANATRNALIRAHMDPLKGGREGGGGGGKGGREGGGGGGKRGGRKKRRGGEGGEGDQGRGGRGARRAGRRGREEQEGGAGRGKGGGREEKGDKKGRAAGGGRARGGGGGEPAWREGGKEGEAEGGGNPRRSPTDSGSSTELTGYRESRSFACSSR